MKIKLPLFALTVLLFAGLPLASSSAYVGVSVAIAPPAIPIYEQPYCPAPGYLWTPGYWAYGDFGYYWVPGIWVEPPGFGLLWTPGYWGYRSGLYVFNQGYWGPTVGFYGGINYGFGYGGRGYYGGRWVGNNFSYNTAVTRVNKTVIKNTYVNSAPLKNAKGSRAGFNGPGGAKATATAQEKAAANAKHVAPTSAQQARVQAAKNDPSLQAKNNKGKPDASAIKQFRNKNETPAATNAAAANAPKANRQGEAGKKGANSTGPAAEKTKRETAKTTDRSRQNANRPEHASTSQARKPAAQKRNSEVRKTSNPARTVRHPQAAPHRAPVTRSRGQQVRPAPRGHGPAPAPQGGKKKKRSNDRPGNG